ncbi:MAG: hypothetical protein LUH63_21615 [Parabacteroides sp.]|nr:hypothetical protein [Parabacteroides sp.]
MQTENQQNRVEEEPSFSYYENLFQLRAGKNLSLTEVYNQIAGPQLRHATGGVRGAIAEGKPERGKELKMQLPAIAVSCRFPEERRTEQAGPYTGYVLVDSDNLTCPAAEYRDRCAALPFVALAHVSAGGNGVHLLVRVSTGVEDHVAVCRSLQQFIETAFGYPVDRSCTDLTRTVLLCHDPEARLNTRATAYLIENGKWKIENEEGEKKFSIDTGEGLRRYLDGADRTLAWMKGQRHANLVSLAFTLNRAGFDERAVTGECIRRYAQPDFGEKEIAKVIASAYTSGRAEHGCNRKEFVPPAEGVSARSACSALYTPSSDETGDSSLESRRLENAKEMTRCFPPAVYDPPPVLQRNVHRRAYRSRTVGHPRRRCWHLFGSHARRERLLSGRYLRTAPLLLYLRRSRLRKGDGQQDT